MRPDEAARIGDESGWEMYDSSWGRPIKWSNDIILKGLKNGNIEDTFCYNTILADLKTFRTKLGQVRISYGNNIPSQLDPRGSNLRPHPCPSRLHPGRSYCRLLLLHYGPQRGTVGQTETNVSLVIVLLLILMLLLVKL